MTHRNVELVRRAFVTDDPSRFFSLFHEDIEVDPRGFPLPDHAVVLRGRPLERFHADVQITGPDPDVLVATQRFVGRMRHTGLAANGYRRRTEALQAAGFRDEAAL